jgi:hypothetical protein
MTFNSLDLLTTAETHRGMTRSLRTDPPAIRAARRARVRVGVQVAPARPGFVHPASRRDIDELLEFFSPLAIYGLQSVELRQAVDAAACDRIVVARLQVPGRVVLYEQPRPPWVIPGLSARSLARLRRAGAVVDVGVTATRVQWPGETLPDFVLFDGLMHEIGHHLVQHHRGKRSIRVVRTADHERYADAFAAACRLAWAARQS